MPVAGGRSTIAYIPIMNPATPRFQKAHLYTFLGLTAAFSALTLWIVLHQSPGDWNDWRGPHPYRAVIFTVTGPFTIAILRPFEPESWQLAWGLFPYCAALLLAGGALQVLPLPFQRGARVLRLTGWILGWLAWFAGGFLALLRAMD